MQWPPRPGPGIERHEAERLGLGRVDHFPHVDVHAVAHQRQLVDQADVHRAERVLEQLHHLGDAGRADRDDRLDRRAVERAASFEQSGVRPPTTFGTLWVWNVGLPGSTRSGENARKKSTPALSPVASSSGCTTSSVVPGIGRRLEDDQHARGAGAWQSPRPPRRCRTCRGPSSCAAASARRC